MPVAAGLGERTEQVVLAQTGTARAEGAKGRTSGKKTEDGRFERLLQGLVRDEKEKEEEQPAKSLADNTESWAQLMLLYPDRSPSHAIEKSSESWAQLMLLYPELATLAMPQEQGLEGIAGGEFRQAIQAAGASLAQPAAADDGVLAAMVETPAEAALAETATASMEGLSSALSGETMEDKALEGTLLSKTATMAMPAGDENSLFPPIGRAVAERISEAAEDGGQPQTGLAKAATAGTAGKTSEGCARTEPADTVGPAAGESGGTRQATGITGTFQTEGNAAGSEPVRKADNAETVRPRIRPAEEDSHEGLPALPLTAEREPKTVVKTGEARLNGELFGQTFSPVTAEAIHNEGHLEGTAAAPEPFVPEMAREDLAAQIVKGARLMVKDGVTKIQIQLEPAELGKLELSLVVEKDMIAARFVTETRGVQSLIEANLPQLRAALEEAGLQVDLLQVGVQTGTDSQLPNQHMSGGEHFRQNTGWQPAAELFVVEEPLFGEEAWHGIVNLRI